MAPHFNKVEKMYFLRIMQEVLPLGSVEWETVANRHNERYTTFPRSVDSIKRQYYSLCKAIPPTGCDVKIPNGIFGNLFTRIPFGDFASYVGIKNHTDAILKIVSSKRF